MLRIIEGNKIMEYAHSIVPIKCGDVFIPNTWKLESVRQSSPCNILTEDFERHQKAGKTILINYKGGWCFKTKEMEIVAEAKTFISNQN